MRNQFAPDVSPQMRNQFGPEVSPQMRNQTQLNISPQIQNQTQLNISPQIQNQTESEITLSQIDIILNVGPFIPSSSTPSPDISYIEPEGSNIEKYIISIVKFKNNKYLPFFTKME